MSGFVYILQNSDSPAICKVGRTVGPPEVRAAAIRRERAYAKISETWSPFTYWVVDDPIAAERAAHIAVSMYNVRSEGARELFWLHPSVAASHVQEALIEVGAINDPGLPIQKQLDQFPPGALKALGTALRVSGLASRRDLERRVWSVSLMPGKYGGRWWTINIGKMEVFYVMREVYNEIHYETGLVTDPIALRDAEVKRYIDEGLLEAYDAPYASKTGQAINLNFCCYFDFLSDFLKRRDIGRSLIAYWQDHLSEIEHWKGTLFSRYHNADLVTAALRHSI